jgi:hypothetical protein
MADAFIHTVTPWDRDPGTEGALDKSGTLLIHPAEWWAQFSQSEIAMFCVRHGIYCVPTTELVDWLRTELEAPAIEIGSGNGVLANALGIAATDSMMQLDPVIKAQYYDAAGQPTIQYGPNVKRMAADEAVRFYKPRTALACWVTHKFRPHEEWREGNQYGVKEEAILKRARYVFVGNENVHRGKPILELKHRHHHFPWLVSRSMTEAPNFIGIWEKR